MYQRVEKRNGYKRITTVYNDGQYVSFVLWNEGIKTGVTKTTIFKMGWSSLAEFLKNRPAFKAVSE